MGSGSVLITGVSGFVGRHLAAFLGGLGAEVFGTVMPGEPVSAEGPLSGARLMECRIEDADSVAEAVRFSEPGLVCHLAAQSFVPRSFENPRETFEANVTGTLNLLEALRGLSGVRKVLLVGSAEVYGTAPSSMLPLTEDARMEPVNPYACSKACAELMGIQYCRAFGVPVVVTRSFNHIGPGQSDVFASSSFARQIAEIEAGLRPPVIRVGNLDARRDFTDVRDVVRAYALALDMCAAGEVYNVCSDRAVGIGEVLDTLLELSGAEVEVVPDPDRMRPSDMPVMLGDSSKLRAATGWRPEIPLEKTLMDLLDYWRKTVGSR